MTYLFRWKITCYTLFFITLAWFLLVGSGIVPEYFLGKLQQAYLAKPNVIWKASNAIILLGAGTVKIPQTRQVEPPLWAYGRITETAIQYRLCKELDRHCTVIVSGGDPMHHGRTEAEVYKAKLLLLGVPNDDIITEGNSQNTWQNAEFTRRIVDTHHFDNLVLVTSGFHMRRSELYFRHFGIHAIPFSADYLSANVSLIPNGYNFAVTDFVIREYVGYVRYFVYTQTT